MFDLIIKNGYIVTPGGTINGWIGLQNGIIAAVGCGNTIPLSCRVIDAYENYVIPGLIDPHFHMESDEDQSIEDGIVRNYPVETEGALHGGVTTFGHFVGLLNEPLVPRLETTVRLGPQFSYVDFFCHACVVNDEHIAEEKELYRKGVTSFKHFFNPYKATEGMGRFAPCNEAQLFRSFERIAALGYPALAQVHCEEIEICWMLRDRLRAAGRNDLLAWTESRPGFAEAIRAGMAIGIAEATRCPLYIVHVSSKETVKLIGDAINSGTMVYAETCPQYLTHTGEMETQIGCWGKVNPSLKYPEDIETLWQSLQSGVIKSIGTDSGTGGRTRTTKERGKGKHNNIWDSRIGVRGGFEHMLPVMMTYGVNKDRISIEDLVKLCSINTAMVFGLYPRKGVLAPGSDADIVLVDPDKEAVIDDSFYHCLCEVSIYEGHRIRGMARTVIIRGKVMMEDFETVGKPGHGTYI
ncbi:MAG: amidohydrolase family protein, partial [Desulfobacterales bacterium]|nr:amidohydrolase family protein [Desulfobacterales bacterium]